jgi:hypothetical protein
MSMSTAAAAAIAAAKAASWTHAPPGSASTNGELAL